MGALLTCPLEVVKTQFQALHNRRVLLASKPAHVPSFIFAFQMIIAKEGLKGMWKGLVPNLVGVFPSRFVSISFPVLFYHHSPPPSLILPISHPSPLPSPLSPLPSPLSPLPSPLCPLPSALCPLPSPLSLLPSALCPLPSALCPLPSALCPLPSPLCPLPSALCLSPLSPLLYKGERK